MSKKSSFALIIPCYNEEKAIPAFKSELIDFISQFKSRFSETELDVILVDNGSTDNSLPLLHDMCTELAVRTLICSTKGYGAALRAGFASQKSDWYAFADLDNTYPLLSFLDMYQKVQAESLKIIYANRLRYQTDMPWSRHLGNRFYALVTRLLFNDGMDDMCSGMRIFASECLETVLSIKANGLRFSIELTAISLKLNWPRAEIPIHYRERLGDSKLSIIKDGILFLFSLLKIRWFYKI